jgi:8-oxo-dGTP pyrophosphatase MutT (NUDIX family)
MHFSAGVVVVRNEGGNWLYLFLRAFANWDFPKGEVEEGEDPLEAAVREVAEETGIRDLVFRWGQRYRETAPYRGGMKIARYYIACTSEKRVTLGAGPELGRPEHHEYGWFSVEELGRHAPERLEPIIDWAYGVVTGG